MEKVEGSYYLLNDELVKNADGESYPEFEGRTVYEVIRVEDGIAIFLEDHLDRFFRSAAYLDLPLPATAESIEDRVYRLIAANQVGNQNLKFILGKTSKSESVLWIFFTQSIYPPKCYYEEGIATSLFRIERLDPNIKLVRSDYQKAVLQERADKGVYELLLVDGNEEITEGSRTNVFFVKGKELYTPLQTRYFWESSARKCSKSVEKDRFRSTRRPSLSSGSRMLKEPSFPEPAIMYCRYRKSELLRFRR